MAVNTAAEKIKDIFSSADANQDGRLSRYELEKTFRAIGCWTDVELDRLFQEADVNNDGVLDYREFVDWILIGKSSKAGSDDASPRPNTAAGSYDARPMTAPEASGPPKAPSDAREWLKKEEEQEDLAKKEEEAARKIQKMQKKRASGKQRTSAFKRAQTAQGKFVCVRGMGDTFETSVKHVGDRVQDYDIKPDADEEKFLQTILHTVPLMQQSSRYMTKLRGCLFGDGKEEKKNLGLNPENILSLQTDSLHKIKICTARSCWREVQSQLDHYKIIESRYLKLRDTQRQMQSDNLRELAFLRDDSRKRTDPETGCPNIVMYYEPTQYVEKEWLDVIYQITKEKLKMIFDYNPNLESIVSIGQLNALKALYEGEQMSEMKETLKKKMHENHQMKLKIQTMERDFKKLQRDGGSGQGCSQDAFLTMDLEITKMKQTEYQLKKELEEAQHSQSRREEQIETLNKVVQEYEQKEYEWNQQKDDMQHQIAHFQKEHAKATDKLERSEKQLKNHQSELKQLKQSVARMRKIDKADSHVKDEYGDTQAPSPVGSSVSDVSKKQLHENQNGMKAAVKELLAVAKQNEEQLNNKIEENHNLQEQVQTLDEENHTLQENAIDLVQEMASIFQEVAMEKIEFQTSVSQELDKATDVFEDASDSKEEVQSETEIQEELHQTEEQIVQVVGDIQTAMATQRSLSDVSVITRIREKHLELSKLEKAKVALKARLAVSKLRSTKSFTNQVLNDAETIISEDTDAIPGCAATVQPSRILASCSKCEENEKKIEALTKTLKMYKIQCKQLTDTLQQTAEENKALHETVEKLQYHNSVLLSTLQSAEGIQNHPAVKACLALVTEARKWTVFDRLYADSQRRKRKGGGDDDVARRQRQERQQRINRMGASGWQQRPRRQETLEESSTFCGTTEVQSPSEPNSRASTKQNVEQEVSQSPSEPNRSASSNQNVEQEVSIDKAEASLAVASVQWFNGTDEEHAAATKMQAVHRGRLVRKNTEEAKRAITSQNGLGVKGEHLGSNSTTHTAQNSAALKSGGNFAGGFKAPPKAPPPSAKQPGKPTPRNSKAKAAPPPHQASQQPDPNVKFLVGK